MALPACQVAYHFGKPIERVTYWFYEITVENFYQREEDLLHFPDQVVYSQQIRENGMN